MDFKEEQKEPEDDEDEEEYVKFSASNNDSQKLLFQGKYEIQEEIGRGNFGQVFEVCDVERPEK